MLRRRNAAAKAKVPTLLDIQTYRFKGHSMSDPQKYRTKDEVASYVERDPIGHVRSVLLDNNWATEESLKAVEKEIKAQVEEAIKFAEESPSRPVRVVRGRVRSNRLPICGRTDSMAEIIRMPKLSDTMTEGVVAEWHKVGEEVESGELLAEIETDKATMEFESFQDGVLLHIGVEKGAPPPWTASFASSERKERILPSCLRLPTRLRRRPRKRRPLPRLHRLLPQRPPLWRRQHLRLQHLPQQQPRRPAQRRLPLLW